MAGRGQQQQQQEPAGEEVKWPEARDKEPGNGFQTIELGDASARPDGAEAAATSMLRRLSSRKARRLEWNVQEYTVRLRRKRTLTILQNIVGRAEAGTLTCIIGPSGCGKTSLLDCIALRNKSFTGTLRLDGKALTASYFLDTAYVHQKELFFSRLTVREHLTFHAINRICRFKSKEECQARVEEVMGEVDLTRVADNRIGGGELYVTKGLSGGERKRLNIATELLADPSTILMDEPTSGLDSVMGELICLLLQKLAARPPQRIVVTAIHAPSSRLFMLFSHVTLLTSDGRLAYWGRRDEMTAFFERLGFVCPSHFNPADFALELASTKRIQGRSAVEHHDLDAASEGGEVIENHGDVGMLVRSNSSPRLVESCARHIVRQQFEVDLLMPDNKHKAVTGVKGVKAPFMVLFRTNLWRSWLQESREKMGLGVRVVMSVLLGLVFGLLFFQQISHDNGRNTAGFLFALLTTLLISSSIQVCLHFPFDFAILMREVLAGANTPSPYFLGRTTVSVLPSLPFLLMGLIPYFMTGLSSDYHAVLYFVLIIVLTNLAAQSLGYLSSSFSSNPIVGISILPLIITPMILFSGMLYERRSVPQSLHWIQEISVVNYAFGALVLNQIDKAGGQVQQFLTNFLQIRADQFHRFVLMIVVLGIVYRALAMLVVVLRVRFISKEH